MSFFSIISGFFRIRQCVLCHGRALSDGLCEGCAADLPHLFTDSANSCPLCFSASIGGTVCGRCQQKPPPFEQLWASAYYEPPLSGMVYAFKHRADLGMLPPLVSLMRRHSPPWLPDAGIGAVLAVPLSKNRRLERGFNQCDELVRELGRDYGWNVLPRHTVFRRHHAPQSTLKSAQRRKNIRHAFEIKGTIPKDCNILLIDDVFTTGATLAELARSLKKSGAGRIYCWTLARSRLKN